MKKMKLLLFVMFLSVCGFSYSQAQSTSPLDPVIAKFNDAANKVNSGDYSNAIAEFQEVLVMAESVGESADDLKMKAEEQIPLLHYQVATGLIKQKKYDEAITWLEKTVQLADQFNNNAPTKEKSVRFLSTLNMGVGMQKYKEKELDQALKYFQSVLKYTPEESKAYLGIGLIYADKSDEQNMIVNLQKAIELAGAASDTKTVEQAQQKLGLFYTSLGNASLADINAEDPDYSSAISNFEKAVSYNPNAADAYYMLSVIYNQTQDFDKVIANGLKALESESDAVKIAAVNYELGVAYFNTADYPKACDCFNKAMVEPIAEKAKARKEKVPNCQ